MLLIAPMDAGITHSRCKFGHYPGLPRLSSSWLRPSVYQENNGKSGRRWETCMKQQVSRLKRAPCLKRPRESFWNWRMASKMRLYIHVSWLDLRMHRYSSMLDTLPPRCQL